MVEVWVGAVVLIASAETIPVVVGVKVICTKTGESVGTAVINRTPWVAVGISVGIWLGVGVGVQRANFSAPSTWMMP